MNNFPVTPPVEMRGKHRSGLRILQDVDQRLLLTYRGPDGRPFGSGVCVSPQEPPAADTLEEVGRISRRRHLLAAFCRFVNSGGRPDELFAALNDFKLASWAVMSHAAAVLADVTPFVETQTPAPALIAAIERVQREEFYRLPDNRYCRVVENEFSETLTAQEVGRLLGKPVCRESDLPSTASDDSATACETP
jgi:hypothetical protein